MKHTWKVTMWQPGHKEQRCKVCGAVRSNFSISVKKALVWSPATLHGKRKPYCQS